MTEFAKKDDSLGGQMRKHIRCEGEQHDMSSRLSRKKIASSTLRGVIVMTVLSAVSTSNHAQDDDLDFLLNLDLGEQTNTPQNNSTPEN
ncbi:MAG: hypothetical protein M3O62_17110, partial [Pseudomonadota bacterium]|nr:hypothetical protein [Pseudomonadota bacterium]